MSAPTDFSQFLRKQPSQEKADNSLSEFSQFKRKEKEPERGAYETLVERPGQIAAQSAVAGLRGLPRTGYDLLKGVVSATGGDISKLEESEKNAPEWLKKVATKAFPTYEEVREDQKKSGKQYRSDKSLAQPEGPVERGVEKFGRFLGEAPAFGGVGGIKGAASLGGLATGMQAAEESDLGPVGQILSGTVGAILPGVAGTAIKSLGKSVISPKQSLAKGIASFTPKDTLALQKQIINDAREAGIQLDVGSITNNKTAKFIQSQLAQSPLTGNALEKFKNQLSEQVANGYKAIADDLGKAQFETVHEAGEVIQNTLKELKEADLTIARDLYSSARQRGGEAQVFTGKVGEVVKELEEMLSPGSIKSAEQKAVLDAVNKLKSDVLTPSGEIRSASINELINNKIALNDIIDYEVQGGAKQLLKKAVKALDETIAAHGAKDTQFAKEWTTANKKFSEHAKTYRNKNISNALKTQDPRQVLSKMNTTKGIRDLKNALSTSEEGKQLFKDLSRFKMDQLLEKNLEHSLNQNLKFGHFASSLKKANNKEILRELLGRESFGKLEKLLKTSGTIAESANKFLNTSQSQTSFVNLAFAGKLMGDLGQFFLGNPLPFISTGGTLLATRQISKLISDPEFLKLVEEAVLASKSGNPHIMERAALRLKEGAQTSLKGIGESNSEPKQEY